MRMLLMIALLPLAACQSNWEKQGEAAQASGTGSTRSFAASGFTGVELRGSDDVDVTTGKSFAVTAEGDSKVLDLLDIRVIDGTLRVGRKDSKDGWFGKDRGARVHVVMPRLTAAAVGGSGNMTVDRAEGDFDGAVSGSGNLRVAELRGNATELSVAGSGDLDIAGSASKLSASVAGSGNINARKLTASSADVSIAGSGNVLGTVKGPASVSIVGSGDADLGGGANCTVNKVGSGEAHCG
ncbi:head GIN domain-containing protein [Sphingomonas sp. HF-S4]|uniref:Head GIN domain-containing protein n=1 Tax=Sphingomonas agrestis TaxID=3080540 RepID=A0ABU3YB46_9SPHN|nr:head GIN domain-containing protein [Sphingomonas sp. HF-S4]MDV3458362.1 head GIN domain-containing protein [Sphingomonas sp. HF-S4]